MTGWWWANGEVPVQVLPETSTADRRHVLDTDCWCNPDLSNSSSFGLTLTHHAPNKAPETPAPHIEEGREP